ncbi:MAG: hypothetical protein FJ100_14490 [Deltaproteobacteria bacterium]|nr:hypothetical protein [Deltaproteobacteria bacterium]
MGAHKGMLALACAAVFAAVGCQKSTEELRKDYDANVLPEVTAAKDAAALPGDASATADTCDCLAKGMWFRFDTLKIKSLDGGPHLVINTLNPIWQNDIKKKELNFFLEIQDVTPTEVKLRILNAARTDKTGGLCLLPVTESVVTMLRSGCKLKNAQPTGLNVYAGTVANPKNCTTGLAVPHAIPVRNAFFEATLAPTCDAVADGLLIEGGIARTALDGTCTCLLMGDQMAEDCGVPDPKFAGYLSSKNEACKADGDCPKGEICETKLNYCYKPGAPAKFCTECCKGCSDKYSNLNELLDSFGPLKYTCKDEKGEPAVCLSATFTAKPAQPPAECK